MLQQVVQHIWQTKGARDAFWMYCGSFASNVGLFFTNVLLARTITQSTFGAFSLALLVLGAVTEFTDFGLNAGLHRFASYYAAHGEEGKLKQLLKTVWYWRITIVVGMTIGGIALTPWLTEALFDAPEASPFLRIAFLGVGGVILSSFVTIYLQATQQFVYAGIMQGAKGLLRLFFVGGAILAGVSSVMTLVALYFAVPWVVYGISAHMLPKRFTRVQMGQQEKDALHKKLARFSSWIVVWSIIIAISSRIDQTIISRYLGLEEVALYSVGMQLIVVYTYLVQSVSTVLTTKMGTATTKEELWRLVKKSYQWILPATFGVGLFIWPSQYLILFFFGEAYRASMLYYVILSGGVLITLLVVPFSRMIAVFNRTEFNAAVSVVQVCVVLGLNLWLIPVYGVLGAAIAFVMNIAITQLITLGIGVYLLRRASLVTL